MSLTQFRLNLTASSFPMLTKHYGASVAGRGRYDTDYVVTNQYSGSQADAFIGIPTFLYVQNCLPYTHGMKSAGYRQIAGGFPGNIDFDNAFTLRYGTEETAIFSPAKGLNYINRGKSWQSVPAAFKMAGMVTIAYLKQKTYICYQGNGIFEMNTATGQIIPVALNGLNTASLIGITAANSYLIAFDSDTIYFSDPTDELDFQPTLASGAGGESILQVRGKIICCLPIENGFIVYSSTNAISAIYSGDSRFPWIYREIDGSAGIEKAEHVAWTSNYAGHYAWTTAGLQLLGVQEAQTVFPEVTDFLSGNEIEDYVGELGLLPGTSAENPAANRYGKFDSCAFGQNQLVSNKLPNGFDAIQIKVALISNRFLIISYGFFELTHMLVYDTSLRRWGKLRRKHTAVFDYFAPDTGFGLAGHRIGVLAKNGRIDTVALETAEDVDKSDSVLFLGRIQTQRAQSGELLAVESSEMNLSRAKLKVISSLNGTSWLPEIDPIITDADSIQCRHQLMAYGKSFVLKYTGDFSLNSIVAEVNVTKGG